jgi:hypothetical protein
MPGTWASKTAATAVQDAARGGLVAVGGKLYVLGGLTGTLASSAQALCQEYDIAGNSWTTKTAMPAARFGGAVVSDGTYIYHVGGKSSAGAQQTTLYRFDPVGNSWATLAAMPNTCVDPGAVFIAGKLYVTGGDSGGSKRLFEYDIAGNSWTDLTATYPPLVPISKAGVVAYGGEMFVISGDDNSVFGPVNTVYKFTPGVGWSTLGAKPGGYLTGSAIMGPIGSRVWVAGGQDFGASNVQECWEYNLATDTWTADTSFSSTARWKLVGGTDGSKGYIFCGRTGAATVGLADEFTPGATGPAPPVQVAPLTGASFDADSAQTFDWTTSSTQLSAVLRYKLTTDALWTEVNILDGTTSYTFPGGSFAPSLTQYEWQVKYTDATGESAFTGSENFQVTSAPKVSWKAQKVAGTPSSVQFTNTSTGPNPLTLPEWTFTQGDVILKSFSDDPLVAFPTNGEWTITLTVYDAAMSTFAQATGSITIGDTGAFIPRKNYQASENQEELRNYLALENWSKQINVGQVGVARYPLGRMQLQTDSSQLAGSIPANTDQALWTQPSLSDWSAASGVVVNQDSASHLGGTLEGYYRVRVSVIWRRYVVTGGLNTYGTLPTVALRQLWIEDQDGNVLGECRSENNSVNQQQAECLVWLRPDVDFVQVFARHDWVDATDTLALEVRSTFVEFEYIGRDAVVPPLTW